MGWQKVDECLGHRMSNREHHIYQTDYINKSLTERQKKKQRTESDRGKSEKATARPPTAHAQQQQQQLPSVESCFCCLPAAERSCVWACVCVCVVGEGAASFLFPGARVHPHTFTTLLSHRVHVTGRCPTLLAHPELFLSFPWCSTPTVKISVESQLWRVTSAVVVAICRPLSIVGACWKFSTFADENGTYWKQRQGDGSLFVVNYWQ